MTSPETDTAPTTQLTYAPGVRPRRRKWVRGVLIAIALLLLMVVAFRLVVPLSARFAFLLQQDRCLRFSAGRDVVAYTEDPATVAKLTGGAPAGPDWATLTDNGQRISFFRMPDALRHLEQSPGVNLLQGNGPVFLHGRTAPGGQERLVVVKVDLTRSYLRNPKIVLGTVHLFNASVMRPATLGSSPFVTRTNWQPPAPVPKWGDLTLLAGQPDWADASHFTIPYQTPAGNGTIDGWLQPDDTLKFQVRDGPLAQPAPTTAPGASSWKKKGILLPKLFGCFVTGKELVQQT